MLRGKHPFKSGVSWSEKDQIAANWNYKLDDVSLEARDFITRCGSAKKFERLDINLALVHPFILRGKINSQDLLPYRSRCVSSRAARMSVVHKDQLPRSESEINNNDAGEESPKQQTHELPNDVVAKIRQVFKGLL